MLDENNFYLSKIFYKFFFKGLQFSLLMQISLLLKFSSSIVHRVQTVMPSIDIRCKLKVVKVGEYDIDSLPLVNT